MLPIREGDEDRLRRSEEVKLEGAPTRALNEVSVQIASSYP